MDHWSRASHLSTNKHLVLIQEGVSGYLQIVWCWSLANPARDIVMRTMTRAKPSTKITSIWQRNATQMCADPDNYKPLWVFNPLSILLRITKRSQINTVGQLDIFLSPTSDENWLATPLNSHCATWLNAGEINLKRGHCKNILTC